MGFWPCRAIKPSRSWCLYGFTSKKRLHRYRIAVLILSQSLHPCRARLLADAKPQPPHDMRRVADTALRLPRGTWTLADMKPGLAQRWAGWRLLCRRIFHAGRVRACYGAKSPAPGVFALIRPTHVCRRAHRMIPKPMHRRRLAWFRSPEQNVPVAVRVLRSRSGRTRAAGRVLWSGNDDMPVAGRVSAY